MTEFGGRIGDFVVSEKTLWSSIFTLLGAFAALTLHAALGLINLLIRKWGAIVSVVVLTAIHGAYNGMAFLVLLKAPRTVVVMIFGALMIFTWGVLLRFWGIPRKDAPA